MADNDSERNRRAASSSYLEADELLQDGQLDQRAEPFWRFADVAPDG